jgi:hypothetical protein
MSRRIAALVLLVLSVATAWVTRTQPALAAGATVIELGWWTTTASTTTPAGGFQVGKTPDGADSAVAAFRIRVDGEVTKAILILVEGAGGQFKEGAGIDACPTTAAWTVASGGPIEQAPKAECDSAKVPLTRNPSAGTWTADLLPLLAGKSGEVSVVLRPGAVTTIAPPTPPAVPSPPVVPPLVPVPTAPAPPPEATIPTPVDPGFTVEFTKADLDSTGSDSSSSSGGGAVDSGSSGTGTIASDTGTSTFATTFSAIDTYAFSDAPSITPTPGALPSATGGVTTQGAGGAGTAASVEAGLQPVAAAAQRGTPPPWGRLLFLLPLSIAVGAFGSGVRRTLLGRSGTAAAAG